MPLALHHVVFGIPLARHSLIIAVYCSQRTLCDLIHNITSWGYYLIGERLCHGTHGLPCTVIIPILMRYVLYLPLTFLNQLSTVLIPEEYFLFRYKYHHLKDLSL